MRPQLASLIAAVFALSAANVGATMIDSFDTGDQWFGVSYRAGYRTASGGVDVSDRTKVLGGHRDVWLKWLSGATSTAEVVADDAVGTGFFFSQGVGEAITTIVWDGHAGDAIDQLGFDLDARLDAGGADQFSLDIAKVTGSGMNLTMIVYTDGTHASATSSIFVPEGPQRTLSLPYTAFNQSVPEISGLADFSQPIGAIVLELDSHGRTGSDIRIRSIDTIPEPSTLVLVAIGAMAFFGLKGRWRKA
jgi:hypothetical protein